jgi:hypothetical protein
MPGKNILYNPCPHFIEVEPRRQESAAPKITFGSGSRRILVRHPVAEGAFIPRQNRGPSA